jgi:hypothetical protein
MVSDIKNISNNDVVTALSKMIIWARFFKSNSNPPFIYSKTEFISLKYVLTSLLFIRTIDQQKDTTVSREKQDLPEFSPLKYRLLKPTTSIAGISQ